MNRTKWYPGLKLSPIARKRLIRARLSECQMALFDKSKLSGTKDYVVGVDDPKNYSFDTCRRLFFGKGLKQPEIFSQGVAAGSEYWSETILRVWIWPEHPTIKLTIHKELGNLDKYMQPGDNKNQVARCRLFVHGLLVFNEVIRFSPMFLADSDKSVATALAFFALAPGDTDDEYFEGYTDDQLHFVDVYGDELQLTINELENKDGE